MEAIEVHPNERLDDLMTNDLKIIQSADVFSFSMDAVLLARFCSITQRGRILDLCTGNGVIPLLLSTRSKATIWGVEIQDRLVDMAIRNVQINQLEAQITMLHGDLNDIHLRLERESFDLVTVNPPYLPIVSGLQNVNEYMAAARHEIHCTLGQVLAACSRMVRTGGKVAMVHRPSRLVDILTLMRENRLEPKRIRFVHPRRGEEANMVLVEAIRDGKPDIKLLPPLIVYEGKNYSEELMQLYYGSSAIGSGEGS